MLKHIENYKIVIVGGGRRCKRLLQAIFSEDLADKGPQILGVADTNTEAVGLQYAKTRGIYTTVDFRELFSIEEMDLILELTPDDSLRNEIGAAKPPGVLFADHHEARAILDYLRIKAKKAQMLRKIGSGAENGPQTKALFEEFYDYVQAINREANTYARETRQDLETGEWTLAQILNGSTIPTFVLDKDHKVTHWNRACEKLTGYSASQMKGTDHQWKPFRQKKRPTMADLVLDGISEEALWRNYGTRWTQSALIAGGFEVEEYFPQLGSGGKWIFFTAVPLETPDGVKIGAIQTLWDQTEQKKAEEDRERKNQELALKVAELSAKEQTMAQIIDGSTIPTFVIDKKHEVTHWNKALERLTGVSARQTVGTTRQWAPFYDQARPSMADVVLDQSSASQIKNWYGERWRESVLIEGAYEAEVFFPNLGDGGKWCWFTAAPIKTPEGEVVGAIETIWDKTEDHKAETERERHTKELATFCSIYATLSSSKSLEDRVKDAVEEVAGIFMLDGVCIFIRQPDGGFHLRYSAGYSDNLCYCNRVADASSLVAQAADTGSISVFQKIPDSGEQEFSLLKKEGLQSLVYIPIQDKDKKAFGVIRAASRKEKHFGANEIRALELIANRIGVAIENALLQADIERRANFQAKLIGSSNDGIIATNDQWKVVIFNPAAEKILGYAASETVDQMDVRAIYPTQVVEALENALTAPSGDGKIPWQEAVVPSKAGVDIPVRFSGTILRGKHKMMGTVAFFHDLREIKRLEKELLQAERLAAVGQTTAGMAHCVKNILHGLKGGSYMVNIGIEKNNAEKLKTGWKMVQRNIGRTSDLVQDLLSYSKEREPEIEPCDPNDIAAEVCELMEQVALEQGVTINKQFSPHIGEVMLDCRSLHRCLLNLVSNAIDACRDDPATDKQHHVTVTTALEANQLFRFDVADNGSGMSEEVKAKLFSSFFSTKGPQGTGLGLLVTRKLIEEHNGRIDVESRLGEGTQFCVRLPC
jgi:PAS domain S-box-containing protein